MLLAEESKKMGLVLKDRLLTTLDLLTLRTRLGREVRRGRLEIRMSMKMMEIRVTGMARTQTILESVKRIRARMKMVLQNLHARSLSEIRGNIKDLEVAPDLAGRLSIG